MCIFCVPYTVWHCTGQHCSFMYACTYRIFVGTWRPTGECYYNTIMLRIFFIVECVIARFLCAMRVFEVRASSSSPIGYLCAYILSFEASIAELARGKNRVLNHSITQSPNLFDPPGTEASYRNAKHCLHTGTADNISSECITGVMSTCVRIISDTVD